MSGILDHRIPHFRNSGSFPTKLSRIPVIFVDCFFCYIKCSMQCQYKDRINHIMLSMHSFKCTFRVVICGHRVEFFFVCHFTIAICRWSIHSSLHPQLCPDWRPFDLSQPEYYLGKILPTNSISSLGSIHYTDPEVCSKIWSIIYF